MKVNRVYSTMTLKSVDEEAREITGIASTPSTDRHGDIVEPKGGEYKLPIPLLFQHRHDKPIGEVIYAKVTDAGIEIRAKLARVDEPGALKDRLDEAWQSIKAGLVKGLSIGFKPIEYAFMDEGGVRFIKWTWLELSAVTIAAQSEATITSIKSIDQELLAASGREKPKVDPPPGVPGSKAAASGRFFFAQSKGKNVNVAEQIKALEAKRQSLSEEREAIQTKAVEAGRSKDEAESERFDEITDDLSAIDKELKDLRVIEKDQIAKATPVKGGNEKEASQSRSGFVQVKDNRVVGKGLAVAQMAKFIAKAQGNLIGALQLAQADQKADPRVASVLKAAVAAGSTSNATWAGNLVGDETSVYADFIEYLRPQTILGRFGANGVPGLRRVPFRTPLVGQTSGGAGYWVGEGNAKPLTKFDFSRTTLEPLKVANIAVVTEEVLRDSSPAADTIIRDQLVAALRERLDIDFIDPGKVAAAGISPASVTNGVTPVPSSGVDADAVNVDVQALFASFIAANNAPTTGVWVMPATTALALSMMRNPLGQAEFGSITMNGGTLFGLPVITSEYVPTDTAGATVALINASDVYLGDDDGFQVDLSREASLQMDSTPDNPTTASTVMVSLWQRNLVGFRAERTINWAKRRPSAVAVLSGVRWGAA